MSNESDDEVKVVWADEEAPADVTIPMVAIMIDEADREIFYAFRDTDMSLEGVESVTMLGFEEHRDDQSFAIKVVAPEVEVSLLYVALINTEDGTWWLIAPAVYNSDENESLFALFGGCESLEEVEFSILLWHEDDAIAGTDFKPLTPAGRKAIISLASAYELEQLRS